jgi:hypothetical protein
MSSFIETTLPPGYRFAGWERGEWRWQSGDQIDQFGCFARHTCCRRAWRHWTAAVLRGRRLHWMRTTDGRLFASAQEPADEPGIRWCPSSGAFGVGVEYKDEARGWDFLTLASCSDPDEAMARFAALVLVAEGTVTA